MECHKTPAIEEQKVEGIENNNNTNKIEVYHPFEEASIRCGESSKRNIQR